MDTRRLWRMWWSGIFTVAAFVHLMRGLANIPVTIGTTAIPIWVSWVVFPVTGFMAGWLMRIALARKQQLPPQSPRLASGGSYPESLGKEEPRHASQAYCGIQAGYHTVGEDDEPEE